MINRAYFKLIENLNQNLKKICVILEDIASNLSIISKRLFKNNLRDLNSKVIKKNKEN